MHFVLDLWSTLAICYRISGDYFGHGHSYIYLLGLVEGAENCVAPELAALPSTFTNIYSSSTGHAFELVIYTPVIIFFSRDELG